MKKKVVALVLLAALMVCSLTGCSKYRKVSDIQESGKLVMFTDARFAPFEYVGADSAITGADIELGQAIAEKMGVELEIINADFDGLTLSVKNGQADMAIAALSITPEREEEMDFSNTYTSACQYIVVREDDSEINCMDDLAGKKVGAQLGTTGDIMVSKQINDGVLTDTGAEIVQYKTLQEGCLALVKGDLDAVVVDDLSAKNYCIVNDGLKCFEARMADGSLEQEPYGVAVAKGNDELLKAINEVVDEWASSGKFQEVLDYHIEQATLVE
ncbi:transporter substrate-binding domain-containing protein [Anaerolentibacter hominis]|uniref:transporter substrate-binding domain-containing protein n=1 Tax=Anaerolentibacter hominis TaxID=3079009 RepID=UPI0031B89D56